MTTAKVTVDGNRQSVQLPPDVHLNADQVFVKQIGQSVLLVPKPLDPWSLFDEAIGQVTDDFMADRNQPPQQTRETVFE